MNRPPPPSDADTARVVAAIRAGNGAAVSRHELADRTGLADRTVRECVHDAVMQGVPIVTNRALGGYAIQTDAVNIRREVLRLRSHAFRLMERAAALEKYGLPEQQEMFG